MFLASSVGSSTRRIRLSLPARIIDASEAEILVPINYVGQSYLS